MKAQGPLVQSCFALENVSLLRFENKESDQHRATDMRCIM